MKKITLFLFSFVALTGWAQRTAGEIGGYTLSPEEGTVEELTSVTLRFTDLGFWGLESGLDYSSVTLTSDAGTVYHVAKTGGADYDGESIMYFGSGAEPETIVTPGNYTLTIPEGVFSRFMKPEMCNDLITLHYTIAAAPENSMTAFRLNPADGSEITKLESVIITFPDAEATGVSMAGEYSEITLTADGVVTECTAATVTGNTVELAFGKEFIRPGDYKLHIPRRMFSASGTDECAEYPIDATFHVVNPSFDPLAKFITTPANGSTVTEFSTLSITFPDEDKGLSYPIDMSGVKLYMNGTATSEKVGNIVLRKPFNVVNFAFVDGDDNPITFNSPATYSVTFPAGIFKEDGADGYANQEITTTFTIEPEKEASPFDNYSASPATGETIGEINQITISFPELAKDRIKWPFDISRVTLQREGDPTVYVGNSAALQGGCNVITGFNVKDMQYSEFLHFRTPGIYTVTIPEGTFASDADNSIVNNEIKITYIVNPAYNFTIDIDPANGTVMKGLQEVSIRPTEVLEELTLSKGIDLKATLTCGSRSIVLTAEETDEGVMLHNPEELTPGEWRLEIPSGMLAAVNNDGLAFSNPKTIAATYTVKTPEIYSYKVSPEEGTVLDQFTKFTVEIQGGPRNVYVNEAEGTPIIEGSDKRYELRSAVSGDFIEFALDGGVVLPDGNYTVTIPANYIVTEDNDKLTSGVEQISAGFVIESTSSVDCSEGVLVLNEGWYGHDMASVTHLSPPGEATYNAFTKTNSGNSLGITGTWIEQYGDRLYATCKQEGENISGIPGRVLTAMDAITLEYKGGVTGLEAGEQARAFCAYSDKVGYLSTSKGVYPVNLEDMTLGTRMESTKTYTLQYGDMMRFHDYVLATVEYTSLLRIDPTDNSMKSLETGPVVKAFVTPDGTLYGATLAEGLEFVKIDPETWNCEYVTLDNPDYTVRSRIASVWSTWTPAPLAVDKDANIVYYATTANATKIARANLDTREFDPEFIVLPSTTTGQQMLYGQGISVDPTTGEIVLTVTEQGYGEHYKVNIIYRVDPTTGKIIDDRTVRLSDYYWFPSMLLYCGLEAPEIKIPEIDLTQGAITLDLLDYTTLPKGNIHLINFGIESSNPQECEITREDASHFTITPLGDQSVTLKFTAEYNGLIGSDRVVAVMSAIGTVAAEKNQLVDVYNLAGILVLRNADAEAIRNLPAGFYIAGGRKILVK